jgi:methionyl-tRNA formyltransferase
VLMGSKSGSVVALSILLERGWDVRYVAVSEKSSQPWIAGQTLQQLAGANGIKVVMQDQLPRNEHFDFVLSYMFRNLVKPGVIDLARRAAVNFHAGVLPEFAGWAFYNMAILENASEYGCTCHYMDESFDSGPILKIRRFPIDAFQETAFSLEQKAQEEMIRLFLDFCFMAETQESLPMEEQDKSKRRYLPKNEFESLKQVPAGANAETIDRHARAFWYPPYEGAYIKIGDAKVEIVPEIAKQQLAVLLHANDLQHLKDVASKYRPEALQ